MSLPGRFHTLHFRLRSRFALWWLRRLGAEIGHRITLHRNVEISCRHPVTGRGHVKIGEGCELSSNVVIHPYAGTVTLGAGVFLGPQVIIYGHGGVEIGDHTLIAMHCRILSSNHTIPPQGTDIRSQPDELRPTKIGRDVWLGAGVTILGGVTIGDGCIVGAGSVVTKDLPAGSICHGIPASVHGWREDNCKLPSSFCPERV